METLENILNESCLLMKNISTSHNKNEKVSCIVRKLSTKLETGEKVPLYFSSQQGKTEQNLVQKNGKQTLNLEAFEKNAAKNSHPSKKSDKNSHAGKNWFQMPATRLTPEIQREFQLLKMRHVIDPKRHYKSTDLKEIPKYFQIGTVVNGANDFYSTRLKKSERKNTLAEELLADFKKKSYYQRRFSEIQGKRQSGIKRYENLKRKKRGKFTVFSKK
eukprot:Sdes_comp19784_c0_seq1m11851